MREALTPELAGFFESGVSIIVGTRDARLVPDCVRAVGARCDVGSGELRVLVPAATAATSVANLRDNGRVAVCFSRPKDHRTIQVKGRVLAIEDAGPEDRALIDAYRCGLAQELGWVGVPPRITLRIAHWPCHALRIGVEALFVQTPGPGAGELLARAAEGPGSR
ncbi:MAG: pyridoxamine 5'-phosphate oxidase family protein [Planctomycetota bacterium]